MTYARARLWLGITGVGSIVTLSFLAILLGLPSMVLQAEASFSTAGVLQLASICGLFMVWLMPLDFLGGFYLPQIYERSDQPFDEWLVTYLVSALTQSVLFVAFGSLIIFMSQSFGVAGGMSAILLGIIVCCVTRDRLLINRETKMSTADSTLLDAITMIQSWQIFVPKTIVVEHKDIGFTGGIVGFGRKAVIVIPKAWLSFSREELATAIARRAVAINSGSYTRGLLLALTWNVGGFLLCSLIPGADLVSVAGLVTTVCGFSLWSFLGLLTLPTLSRSACLKIDQELVQLGMPSEYISKTAKKMDEMQDGEPERPAWIETIFHPVPNVSSRNSQPPIRGPVAWNVARTALFFSWACMGFLSRSVHCNVGRPELWTMLPAD